MPQNKEKPHRKPVKLNYKQRQAQQASTLTRRLAINKDVDEVLDYVDKEVKMLSLKHKHSPAWFYHQFYQGGRIVRQRRAPGICNAARQVDGFLNGRKGEVSDTDRERFEEIKKQLVTLKGPDNASALPAEMKEFLIEKAKKWRVEKQKGLRVNARAIVQDARCALERISDELIALSARTEMQSILIAVPGKPEHTNTGVVAASEKGRRFLLHGLKKSSADLLKEFEAYVFGDVEGLVTNHNGRLAMIKGKIRAEIRQGLVDITGDQKVTMQYERYEKCLVVDRGVQLINWPNDVPFKNASDISSLQQLHRLHATLMSTDEEDQCRWVRLSADEWEARKEAYYEADANAEPRTRKRKRKAPVENEDEESEASSADEESEREDTPPPKKKKKTKGKGKGKENESSGVKGGKKASAKGKVSAKKKNAAPGKAALQPANTNA